MYHIFISHSWRYGDQYYRLTNLLKHAYFFQYSDYSIPKDDPVHCGSDKELREAIINQMSPCSGMIILAGVYATHSKWINAEISIAKNHFAKPKPIIAVRPHSSVKISAPVQASADRVVGWNTHNIVATIRELF